MNLQDKLLEATISEIEQEYYTTPKIIGDREDLDIIEFQKNEILNNRHTPILISADKETILDGNHRWIAYQELGIDPPLVYKCKTQDFYDYYENNDDWVNTADVVKQLIDKGIAIKV